VLKTRFIDKILEALGDEAGKIKIFDNTSIIYFYNTDDKNQEIINVLRQLKLQETIEKYNLSEIVIDYGLKSLKIETKNGKVIIKNLGKYGTTGLWTMVIEIVGAKND
jgi:hypothetical protein